MQYQTKTKYRLNNTNSNEKSDSLNWYLSEISRVPLLSREEEKALIEKAQKGNEDAAKKLIAHSGQDFERMATRSSCFSPVSIRNDPSCWAFWESSLYVISSHSSFCLILKAIRSENRLA